MDANTSRYIHIPKVEIHRHLEGSLRLSTLREAARAHAIELPEQPDLGALVQMQPEDGYDFAAFLSKFGTLRLFYQSPELIDRLVREVVEDARNDSIRYLELMFTPVALSRVKGYPLGDVMDWVSRAALEAGKLYGVQVGLIASVNRHEPVELAETVIGLSADRLGQGVVGVNLAGNEAQFSALPFAGLFRQAKQAGLGVTIHAGEWGPAENVREAILELDADRIGHGVHVIDDPYITALAREREIVFEVCITSNLQTGSVPALHEHPIRAMLAEGLKVTLNSDDPAISQITLSHEYQLACEQLGISRAELDVMIQTAAEGALLPEDERLRLLERVRFELAAVA